MRALACRHALLQFKVSQEQCHSGLCLWLSQAATKAPQGALYDPHDPATPYRQGTQDDHALHAALRHSLAQQHRGNSNAEEQLKAAIAASLEASSLQRVIASALHTLHLSSEACCQVRPKCWVQRSPKCMGTSCTAVSWDYSCFLSSVYGSRKKPVNVCTGRAATQGP